MRRLLTIVPTRCRPGNIAGLVTAYAATRTSADLLVWVDDDPDDDYPHDDDLPDWCRVVRSSTRRRLCGSLNHAAPIYANGYDVIGFMGDDHRPRTLAWDQRIIDEMPPLGVVYGDDTIQGENLPTAVWLDSVIVRRTGRFVHPDVVHLYCDNAWKVLGTVLGTLTYLPDVVIEHLHPVAGKALMDESYAESNHPSRYADDKAHFDEWLYGGGLAVDLARILDTGKVERV